MRKLQNTDDGNTLTSWAHRLGVLPGDKGLKLDIISITLREPGR